jgi:pilus assembly protein CpaB
MKQKLLIAAALFFGTLAFILTYQQIKYERQKALGGARDLVLIALTRDIAEGEKIKESDLAPYKLKRFVTDNTRDIPWDQRGKAIGRELAVSVVKGTFLQWDDMKPASRRMDGLTSLIPMGFRAISISVDATSSVTGLVQPGDHVDIIGTFRFPDMKGDRAYDTLTLTILQNVGILATGTDMGKSSGARGDQGAVKRGYSTVTMALTPKEVEMIIFAAQKGQLTLSLRNYEETKMETQLQSVNFKYLQDNIQKYNSERESFQRNRKK